MNWHLTSPYRSKMIAPIVPLVAMVMLFCLLATFSVWWTARNADRLDQQRTQASIEAAIQSQISQIAALAYDNGYSDDAAAKLTARSVDRQFTRQTWGMGTEQAIIYDRVFAFDAERKVLFAYEKGQPTDINYLTQFGPSLNKMAADLDSHQNGSAGLVKTNDGLWIVGIANVMASSPDVRARTEKRGPVRLVLARNLSNALLAEIGKATQVKNLRLGPGRPGSQRLEMRDPAGRSLGQISWIPNQQGIESLWKALPLLGAGLLLSVVIAGFLIRGRQSAHTELEEQAMIDSLSQLPNRRALHHRANIWLEEQEPLSLALIDLDGFKSVNDNYGHDVGDQLIKECAKMLTGISDQSACVARLGGDEFAILLHGPDSASKMEAVASQFLWRLDRPFKIGERTVVVGASIGLATTGDEQLSAAELVRRADIAMYAAKEAGRMRTIWFDVELDKRQAASHKMELELRDALDRDDFQIDYQPIYKVKGKAPVAVEALVRWTSPESGAVDPEIFMPIAEESGLIDRIGNLVLRKACVDALNWPGVRLAVNVSAAQLRNPDFPVHVAEILGDVAYPAQMLELEITESALISDKHLVERTLAALRAIGVSISLDDFGTGFASIGLLRQCKFEKLKIDRALVTDTVACDTSRILLQATVAVARGLRMTVVAEGVESAEQADLMRVAGCDELQGDHFSPPVPADTINAILGYQARRTSLAV